MNSYLTKEQQKEKIEEYKNQGSIYSHPIAGDRTVLELYCRFSHNEILEEIEYRESHCLECDIDYYPGTKEWFDSDRHTDKYWFHAILDDLYLAESFYRFPLKKLKIEKAKFIFSRHIFPYIMLLMGICTVTTVIIVEIKKFFPMLFS